VNPNSACARLWTAALDDRAGPSAVARPWTALAFRTLTLEQRFDAPVAANAEVFLALKIHEIHSSNRWCRAGAIANDCDT